MITGISYRHLWEFLFLWDSLLKISKLSFTSHICSPHDHTPIAFIMDANVTILFQSHSHHQFLEMKEAIICHGEKTVSSISGIGKTGQLHVKEWNYNTSWHCI